MANGNWLAGNWWQLLSALVLFGSYVAVLAKAVHSIKSMESRLHAVETELATHRDTHSLHRSPDFDLRVGNIETGIKVISDILIQVQIDLGALLKFNIKE